MRSGIKIASTCGMHYADAAFPISYKKQKTGRQEVVADEQVKTHLVCARNQTLAREDDMPLKCARFFHRLAGPLIIAVAALTLIACSTAGEVNEGLYEQTFMPDRERLETRIKTYYTAVGNRNSAVMYEMSAPYVRALMTLEDYRRDWGLEEAWTSKPRVKYTAEVEEVCGCLRGVFASSDRPETTRCVLLLNITEQALTGESRKGRQLEMWEYLDGEWYFGYPGRGNECPRLPSSRE